MAEPIGGGSLWSWRAVFLLTALAVLFAKLLPLGLAPGRWPGPDIPLALVCAWVLRRPAFVPVWLIGAVFLLEDMLLMRPPGLWAALVLLGTEFLRSRAAFSRQLSFPVEWLMISVVMLFIVLGYRLGLAITLTPLPGLGASLIQLAATVLTYPLIVGISWLAFGLRKPATGEVDNLGRRL